MFTSGLVFKGSLQFFLEVSLHLGPFRGEVFHGKRLEPDVPSFKSDGFDVHSGKKLEGSRRSQRVATRLKKASRFCAEQTGLHRPLVGEREMTNHTLCYRFKLPDFIELFADSI